MLWPVDNISPQLGYGQFFPFQQEQQAYSVGIQRAPAEILVLTPQYPLMLIYQRIWIY